jgi:hypothetical protein
MFLGGALILGSSIKAAVREERKSISKNDPKPFPQDTSKSVSQGFVKKEGAIGSDPCDDLTGVSAEDLDKRKKLAYVIKSPIPDSHCSNCALHLPPAKGKTCGGCLLFKGPVRDEGYCAYWAPVNK